MERYRQTIYCDFDFLKLVLSKHEETSGLDNLFYEETEMISSIRNLILSSDVKLHLNKQEYDKTLSDINRKRVKAAKRSEKPDLSAFEKLLLDIDIKQQNNELHLKKESKRIQFDDSLLPSEYLNAIFFSCESQGVCEQAMRDYGIIVICAETIKKDFRYLMFDHGAALRKDEETNWGNSISVRNDINPCNSLIIIDNYLLNDGDLLKENLTSLLDVILPKKLKESVRFDLTIFAKLENGNNVPLDVEGRFNKVMEILHEIRPQMEFSLSILKCSKDKFHDRNIASVNLYVSSGYGFSLFKNGMSQKTTTVNAFHPFFYMHSLWARKAYSDLLNEASVVYRDASILEDVAQQYRIKNYIFGTKKNRLLDQIIRNNE